MVQYPGRVYSKPEFTALPPCIFSGAEFALMPSRDEPFGLVAVEFGRKGALCVGSRVGGFGHMPGWWFTVEAVTSKHLISQFNTAISAALSSNYHTRATMRAWSKLQRFPVAQWVEDLEKLQTSSVELSMAGRFRGERLSKLVKRGSQYFHSRPTSSGSTLRDSTMPSTLPSPGFPAPTIQSDNTSSRVMTPRGSPHLLAVPGSSASTTRGVTRSSTPSSLNLPTFPFLDNPPPPPTRRGSSSLSPSLMSSPPGSPNSSPTQTVFGSSDIRHLGAAARSSSNLSLTAVASAHSEAALLQNAAPIFLDSKNIYYNQFSQKLDKLATKQSTGSMLIEEYLVESERDWFNKYHRASLAPRVLSTNGDKSAEFFELLGDDYEAPRGVKMLMQKKIGTWYIYSYLLALVRITHLLIDHG
jgi:alpha-1,3-glucan synthase